MNPVCIDIESYYSDITDESYPRSPKYTLSALSTEEYIRDPRFELHGAGIKWSADHEAKWYDEKELRYVLKEHDWSDTLLICHHHQWDGYALAHHYGVRPKMRACTLAMARLMNGAHMSVSLESVRKHYDIPPKITPYRLFINKHWHELDGSARQLVADGACDEVESIWKIFGLLLKQGFPSEEMEVVHGTLEMFCNPVLRADLPMLAKVWTDENDRKAKRMAELNVDAKALQSADKFAELLRAEGVEPETKQSDKGNTIYAFAKTDQFMRDLLEDDNERIRTLAEARLGQKSTLLQTRAETLGWMGRRGPLCVYLSYAGTGTLRPSGGDSSNFLNMKRGSDIRRSILAPDGFYLAPVDSSQIEARVCAYLAGQTDLVEKFRSHGDPYSDIATEFYGEKIYKPAKDDPRAKELEQKRGCGKQAILMCQYGCAAPKYKATAKAGLYGPSVEMSIETAEQHVQIYRENHPAICAKNTGYWAQAGKMLARLSAGEPIQWGPLLVKDHRIFLPNGCPLIYDSLEYHKPLDTDSDWEYLKDFERGGYWRVKTRRGWKKMWGSKLVQNICEAVSRVIVTQAMVRLQRMGYRTLNHPYDELLLLIPKDGNEQRHLEICKAEMVCEPTWLPGIPLDCEGELSERYSK